jgi:bifunctional non-homologous end joining protein LigD
MPKDLFCIPTAKKAVPAGPDWIHEVKYDGYRVRVERNGDRVWLLSKSGLDWTKRYPWIVETARKIRKSQFIIRRRGGHSRCRRDLGLQRPALSPA